MSGPTVAQATATEVVVTNNSDVSNGDTSTFEGLVGNPGEDGISIREAIDVTNNDPGSYSIAFDPSLSGSTVTLSSPLPELTGGGVAIEGDIDGNGVADVTITSSIGSRLTWGFTIASSGNRIDGLGLRRFLTGVEFQPSISGTSLPDHQVYADNVVANMVIRNVSNGIFVGSGFSTECPGPPEPQRCETFNTWTNTSIIGNTVRAHRVAGHDDDPRGIALRPTHVGDSVVHATVTDNDVRVSGHNTDIGIGVQSGLDSTSVRISDVLIARNIVSGPVGIGIEVTAGANRAQFATTENVRVIDNEIALVDVRQDYCCQGIVVQAGSDTPNFAKGPPVRYLDDNRVRDVVIRGNSVTGELLVGLSIAAGRGGGGRRNRVTDVNVIDNLFRSDFAAIGINVITGTYDPYRNRHSEENKIARLLIKENRIRLGNEDFGPGGDEPLQGNGVLLLGGYFFARDSVVRDVRVARNAIRVPDIGIALIGGFGPEARRNRVQCVPRAGNRIIGARRKLSVRSNVRGASGNRAGLGGC